MIERRPRDRKSNAALSNSDHQHIHLRLAEVPFSSVYDRYVGRIARHQVKQKPPELLVAKGKPGEKALDTPVGRTGLDLWLHHLGQLGEIRGRLDRERPYQSGHQLHASPVPAEPIRENAHKLPHVR